MEKLECDNKYVKIAVVGNSHSGKSVFANALCSLLPKQYIHHFRACPDGEGTWTWKDKTSSKYRRKGIFTTENLEWYLKVLKYPLAPLTIIDVGGKIDDKNKEILSLCTHCIIVSNSIKSIVSWNDFVKSLNIYTIAKIHSVRDSKEDSYDDGVFTCHNLDREDRTVEDRFCIKKCAEQVFSLIKKITLENKVRMSIKEPISSIDIADLATLIGKKKIEKTLPNGEIIKKIVWEGKDLVEISRFLHSKEKAKLVDIDGATPGFLVSAITHECHPSSVRINSPDGYVGIGCQEPSEQCSGINLQFEIVKVDDKTTRVNVYQQDPALPLKPEDLSKLVPPKVDFSQIVILSGRLPNWMMASLVMSYHGKCKAIACFQPGVGATVVVTHSPTVELGKIIEIK